MKSKEFLKYNAFMNGGNTPEEKAYFKMGFEAAMEEYALQQPGPRWVKASERLWVKVGALLIKEIDRAVLAEDFFDVDFDGHTKVRIANTDGYFSVYNAMDGWGNNIYQDLKNDEVTFLTAFTQSPKELASESPVSTPSGEGMAEVELDALAAEKDYWYNRCVQAEAFIEASPCDPDITADQIEAYKLWQESKKRPASLSPASNQTEK